MKVQYCIIEEEKTFHTKTFPFADFPPFLQVVTIVQYGQNKTKNLVPLLGQYSRVNEFRISAC
jgi:hypothetical protein